MLLGVDVGGTFTDAVLATGEPRPELFTAKVPSTPDDQARGVLDAVRAVLDRAGADPGRVRRFAHGMTVATNALLEGRTARTALVATEGFTDVIELGRQNRPSLYDLCLAPPEPLVPPELRFPARERMGPHGPLLALAPPAGEELARRVAAAEPEAVAVSLLHSYADDSHEQRVGELLAERLPGAHVSLSSDLVGTFREYERTATTVIDAALSPLLADYLSRLAREAARLGIEEPHVMQSSGGLTEIGRAGSHAALTVLSGPAGGVGGALLLAELADEPRVLCFDMGGTSCDVSVIDGYDVRETAERTIGGRPLALPALDIHTVGAGGGSIAWRDRGGALRVGPQSAGAVPGPACYGRGGERPTVTDANLLLGRLDESSPLAGGLRLDREAAARAISALAGELRLEEIACAEGIVRVAEAGMLAAMRVMTVERGIDPRGFALMPFGGAGPLHAAALAGALGISRVLCPRASGVLSALGLAAAAPRRDTARTVMLDLRDDADGRSAGDGGTSARERLDREREALVEAASRALGEPAARVRVRHELRYRGQSFELTVEEELPEGAAGSRPEELVEEFASAHERRYGYRDADADVELVNIRASAWGAPPALAPPSTGGAGGARGSRRVFFDGRALETSVYGGELAPGTALAGPAVCALAEATVLVPPGWEGEVDTFGSLLLRTTGRT